MLTYLINVTGDLLTIAIVTGVILAFADHFFGEKARSITRCGLILGVIAAAIRAYITNTRRLVGGWKVGVYGYTAALVLFVILVVVYILFIKGRKEEQKGISAFLSSDICLSAVIALIITAYFYGALPNVLVYPFKFDIGTSSILSTDFLFRLGGYLLGLIISFVSALAAYKITSLAAKKGYEKHLSLSFLGLNLLYAVNNFARLMLVLIPRKIIQSKALFKFAAASNNQSSYYTYLAFILILALAAMLWVRSKTVKEPYRTKAEHRKQLAMWRTGRRYGVVTICCMILAILCSTWFVKLNTEEIREAPVEDPVIIKSASGEDETLMIPVDAVSDGHLHRFGYTTDDGHLVRMIIVLKQEGTSNYGVGLDACDICGEAGYFENKDGQIVCKKCNVVMNRSTIGMKGGCNPIIIDYDFDGSQFTVPVEEMIKNKDKFKNS